MKVPSASAGGEQPVTRPLEWLATVRDHPKRPGGRSKCFEILTMLALRLDWSTGAGFASVRELADDARACERTVKSATGWARTNDLLLLTRRGHYVSPGRTVASEWRLTMPVDNPSQGATGRTLEKANVQVGASQRASGTHTSRPVTPRPVENTAASRRDRTAARSAAKGQVETITDPWIDAVAEEIIGETRANGDEAAVITNMIENGSHPLAVRNKISADRFGTRSERHSTAARCRHDAVIAADGSCCTRCDKEDQSARGRS